MKPEQAAALRKAFPASAIGKLPKGGVMLDYCGHAAVTDRLLTVDPEWTWEPLALDAVGLPALDAAGNLWIRLTVAGVTRIGVGDGKNMKERIGDALRNAAMRFGVALDLWTKDELESGHAEHKPEGPKPPESMSKAMQGKLFALLRENFPSKDFGYAWAGDLLDRDVEHGDFTKAEAEKLIPALEAYAQGVDPQTGEVS